MMSFRGKPTRINNEDASVSQAHGQDLSSFVSPHLSDGYSLEEVFAGMVKDLNDLMDEVSAKELEFSQIKGSRRKSRSHRGSSQNTREDEYMEILNNKGKFLEGITATIDKMDSSPEIPKTKIHCYQKLVALLKQMYDETNQDIHMRIENLKMTKQECERLKQQVETFKTLKNDEENMTEGEEIAQLFREAKANLAMLLSVLYPEDVQEEFTSVMAEMTEAFMKNDNEEDQYVELSPESLKNLGIVCLVEDCVIVVDPSNPLKFRLNMAE